MTGKTKKKKSENTYTYSQLLKKYFPPQEDEPPIEPILTREQFHKMLANVSTPQQPPTDQGK